MMVIRKYRLVMFDAKNKPKIILMIPTILITIAARGSLSISRSSKWSRRNEKEYVCELSIIAIFSRLNFF